jgi:hypothetical protein
MYLTKLLVDSNSEVMFYCFQCVAWFGASALASVPARLSLAELRAFRQQSNQQYEVVAGNTVALHCGTPYSNPPALVQYYRNKEKLQSK